MHTSDLGGAEGLSQAQQQLIRRIVTLEVQLEVAEGRMVSGDMTPADLNAYATATNSLHRLLRSLGLKPSGPSRPSVTIAAHQRRARIPAPERCDQLHVRQSAVDRLRERGEQAAREQAKQAEAAACEN
jgi:phage terminase small subunit